MLGPHLHIQHFPTLSEISHHALHQHTARLHDLQPVISSSSAGYTPADHRTLSILSYFHARFLLDITSSLLNQISARSWDTSRPLCVIPLYAVDCTVTIDKVILTGAGSEDVVEEEIGVVLNGTIVGMVGCDPGAINVENNTDYILSTTLATSHQIVWGLRSFVEFSPPIHNDPAYLHLLTPLPHSLLACACVLV